MMNKEQYDALQAHANQDARHALEMMKDQLIVALIKRMGGKLTIAATEVDATGGDMLLMAVNEKREFEFEVRKKH